MTLWGDRNHLHWRRAKTFYQFSSLLAIVLSCSNQLAIHDILSPSVLSVQHENRLMILVLLRIPKRQKRRKQKKSFFMFSFFCGVFSFVVFVLIPRVKSLVGRFRQGRQL